LEFSDDGRGGFRIQLTHPDGDLILLHQPRNRSFTAVALVAGQLFAGHGKSFLTFFRQHQQQTTTHVLPALAEFGIYPILSPHTPKVRKAVLAALLRKPEALAEGKRLLADLDSEQFAARENASQLLSERFEIYKDLIQDKLQDKSISLEVQTRLQSILAKHPDSHRVGQTVAALNLMDDAGYLVQLLDHASAEETSMVVSHLEKTTGENLGSDPAAWKEWAKKKVK
jgi:hypothetical protein